MDLILDIDTQVDFMQPFGSLYVPKAETIIGNIKNLLSDLYLPIISTVDEHDENDEEFNTFPRHCVKNTHGAWKIPETLVYSPDYVTRCDKELTPLQLTQNKQFILPKRTYNIWDEKLGNPDAMNQILEHFCPEIIHVMGIATDICVLAMVKGLAEIIGYTRIILHIDCMKGLTTESEEKALEEMLSLPRVWDSKETY